MKKILFAGILIHLLFAVSSCESDIDLIHESNGKPVVYCLLNPADSVQYLRVSRSFIIRGNPYLQDIVADSLILDEDFYAYLEQVKPDGTRDIFYFDKTPINQRDSGLFPQEGLAVLQTKCVVHGGQEYALYVHFPRLPKVVAGSVTIVNPVEILDPNPLPGREITILHDQGYLSRWTKSLKFAVYQTVVRFIYLEGDKNSQYKKEVIMPQPLIYGDSENALLTGYLNGAGFVSDLLTNLSPPDSALKRKIIGFDFLISIGGPELAVYTRSGQNAIAAFTGLDDYSNLDGAAGIFSSFTFVGSYNNRFSDITINYLADSEKTRHLGFLKFNQDFVP